LSTRASRTATRERPALFFTVLGEPPLKMLRYQQQFSFFDPDKINESIRFVSMTRREGLNDEQWEIIAPAGIFKMASSQSQAQEGTQPLDPARRNDRSAQTGGQPLPS